MALLVSICISILLGYVSFEHVMSVSLLEVAKSLGKNPRTIRRWCERRFVPGAYRTKGGHWRIRKMTLKTVTIIQNRVSSFARRRSPQPEYLREIYNKITALLLLRKGGTIQETLRAHALVLAAHGLTDKTIFTEHLPEELRTLIFDTPLSQAISPEIIRGSQQKVAVLHVAARAILSRSPSGKGLTAKLLAKELNFSRATLYRRYETSEIKHALESSYSPNELRRDHSEIYLKSKGGGDDDSITRLS